jgi:ABC-type nitrate/sulfonate/bicarbonate transport system substrate-binding protein
MRTGALTLVIAGFLAALHWVAVLPSAPSPAKAAGRKMLIGYSSAADFHSVPSLMAIDVLRQRGYEIEPVFFSTPELNVAAEIRGDVQLSTGSVSAAFAAITKGAPLKLITAQNGQEWAIVATREVKACGDLNGKRLGIHSEAGVSTAMLRSWMASRCPEAKPQILVVPGSENRAAALSAGRLDATPLELDDAINVVGSNPSRFYRLVDFSRDLPDLLNAVFYTRVDTLRANRAFYVAYVTALLQTHRAINATPQLLIDAAPKYLPKMKAEDLKTIVGAYIASHNFDNNGGLSMGAIQYSIDFYDKAGQFKPGLKAADTVDLSVLNEVLQTIGRR